VNTMHLSATLLHARWARLPPMTPVLEYCFGRERRDDTPVIPARAATCGRVAEALGTRSTTLLERSIGAHLGTKLGIPAAAQIRDEMQAVRTFASASATTNFDCSGMKRQTTQIRETLRWGEIPSMLRAIEASDTPLAQRVEQARSRRLRDAAASAAAAVAAGSGTPASAATPPR